MMCYSAMVWSDYRSYTRAFDAQMDWDAFLALYRDRDQGRLAKWPKAMDAAFLVGDSGAEREIQRLITKFNAQVATQLEKELFAQQKRLADAQRKLKTKTTKAATESERIATEKITKSVAKLGDLHRQELKERDSRIFPGYYAPTMVEEQGARVIRPMRYQCRPAGKPSFYDRKYPGTYNARRDNLNRFWKELYGFNHGVIVIKAFFENVSRHALERRPLGEQEAEENVVLEFRPNTKTEMIVACLWSRWQGAGEPDLLSFAAITDEPPPEVAAAGHDRCIVAIKTDNVGAWLEPGSASLSQLEALLDDRDPLYFEHRVAAASGG